MQKLFSEFNNLIQVIICFVLESMISVSYTHLDVYKRQGLVPTVIATDGIAVIVNTNNAVDDLTVDQVKQIYTGEITDWSEISA